MSFLNFFRPFSDLWTFFSNNVLLYSPFIVNLGALLCLKRKVSTFFNLVAHFKCIIILYLVLNWLKLETMNKENKINKEICSHLRRHAICMSFKNLNFNHRLLGWGMQCTTKWKQEAANIFVNNWFFRNENREHFWFQFQPAYF